ncbi:MAG: cbb3-type cytochrome oxidase assembly protein CcoS [Verrucomicrobiota bacterium]
MSVLIILILVSLIVAGLFLCGFIWAVNGGQFEDTCTPSMRILLDEPAGQQTTRSAEDEQLPGPAERKP